MHMGQHDQLTKSEAIVVGAMIQSESFAGMVKGRGFRPDMLSDPLCRVAVASIYDLLDEGRRVTLNLVAGRVGPSESGLPTEGRLALMVSAAREAEGSAIDEVDPIQEAYSRKRLADIGRELLKAADDRDNLIDVSIMGAVDNLTDLAAGAEAKDRRMTKVVARVRSKAREAYAKRDQIGQETGLTNLDEMLGGIMPGRLTVIGGGPGAGKSALGYQILHKAAKERGGGLYFQRDMGEADVINRALSMLTEFPVRKIEGGEFDAFELSQIAAAEQTLDALDIDLDTDATTIEDITAIATAKKRAGGLSMILVDHLRKYGTRRKVKDKWETYGVVTGGLKELAVKLDVPVVLLSQITRIAQRKDNPVPEMQDLDGGGSLEQDADTIVILFNRARWILREKLGGERPQSGEQHEGARAKAVDAYFNSLGKIEAHLSKHRLAAPDQKCDLKFNGKASCFVDA